MEARTICNSSSGPVPLARQWCGTASIYRLTISLTVTVRENGSNHAQIWTCTESHVLWFFNPSHPLTRLGELWLQDQKWPAPFCQFPVCQWKKHTLSLLQITHLCVFFWGGADLCFVFAHTYSIFKIIDAKHTISFKQPYASRWISWIGNGIFLSLIQFPWIKYSEPQFKHF